MKTDGSLCPSVAAGEGGFALAVSDTKSSLTRRSEDYCELMPMIRQLAETSVNPSVVEALAKTTLPLDRHTVQKTFTYRSVSKTVDNGPILLYWDRLPADN